MKAARYWRDPTWIKQPMTKPYAISTMPNESHSKQKTGISFRAHTTWRVLYNLYLNVPTALSSFISQHARFAKSIILPGWDWPASFQILANVIGETTTMK